MEIPTFMLYPTLELNPDRGILPNVHLPSNYEELVSKFYKQGRKKGIEDYVEEITKLSKIMFKKSELDIRLNWDDKKGLTNISLGIHPGFDLVEHGFAKFQEHNLGMEYSILAGIITQKYISELLKSE